jgi:ribosome biogenesis GTPase A
MEPWKSLLKVIRNSDIVIEVVDCRFPETRSRRLEELVRKNRKKLLIVLNKCDLLKEPIKTKYLLFSARTRRGKSKLLQKLNRLGGGKVGVIGFPNTGKSSLINAVAGRKAARTSPKAGFTKGPQYIRAAHNILFFDSPGVIPSKESGETLSLIGAFDPDRVDSVISFYKLLPKIKDQLRKKFKSLPRDKEKILEKIAVELNMVRKGGEPDLERAARHVIRRWQRGKPL